MKIVHFSCSIHLIFAVLIGQALEMKLTEITNSHQLRNENGTKKYAKFAVFIGRAIRMELLVHCEDISIAMDD